jgi:hypothetical protein
MKKSYFSPKAKDTRASSMEELALELKLAARKTTASRMKVMNPHLFAK